MSKLSRVAARSPAPITCFVPPPVRTTIRTNIQQRCKSTTINSSTRQVLPKRHLAQVRPEPLSELWFTSSSPRSSPEDELLGSSTLRPTGSQDHKPPDERLIKLGKSMFPRDMHTVIHLLTLCSFAHSVSSPPQHSYNSSSSRHSLAQYQSTSFPIHPPTLACCKRPSCLPCGTMDCTSCLGLCPHSRQCQATYCI